uniref:Uncharacterized protein n=1 Tax=Rhizophora mucronata TaxID=61149 RepID=A0A2P2QPV5_RHIMU
MNINFSTFLFLFLLKTQQVKNLNPDTTQVSNSHETPTHNI